MDEYDSDSSSNSGKSEFDDEYHMLKPPDIPIENKKRTIIKIHSGQYSENTFDFNSQIPCEVIDELPDTKNQKPEPRINKLSHNIGRNATVSTIQQQSNDSLNTVQKYNIDYKIGDTTPNTTSTYSRQYNNVVPVSTIQQQPNYSPRTSLSNNINHYDYRIGNVVPNTTPTYNRQYNNVVPVSAIRQQPFYLRESYELHDYRRQREHYNTLTPEQRWDSYRCYCVRCRCKPIQMSFLNKLFLNLTLQVVREML